MSQLEFVFHPHPSAIRRRFMEDISLIYKSRLSITVSMMAKVKDYDHLPWIINIARDELNLVCRCKECRQIQSQRHK